MINMQHEDKLDGLSDSGSFGCNANDPERNPNGLQFISGGE